MSLLWLVVCLGSWVLTGNEKILWPPGGGGAGQPGVRGHCSARGAHKFFLERVARLTLGQRTRDPLMSWKIRAQLLIPWEFSQ